MNKDEFYEKMFSYKALFNRAFFMCRECGFVFTVLGQASHEIEGCCPSCGDDVDYAPKSARDKFIQGFRDELKSFDRELKND